MRGVGQRQSSQSRKSECPSESGEDSRDDRQSVPIERDAHASSSDEAINDSEQLAERIGLNNDIMRQCRETFETLHARNAKLVRKLEAMRARLTIPEWSQLEQSPSGACGSGGPGNPVTLLPGPGTGRTYLDIATRPPQGACQVNPAAAGNPAALALLAPNPPPMPARPIPPLPPDANIVLRNQFPGHRLDDRRDNAANQKGKDDRPAKGARGPRGQRPPPAT